MYKCPAMVYAYGVDNKITLSRIVSGHTHPLLTSKDIELQISMSKKSIPENVRELSYNLFLEGKSCKDIYSFIEKAEYQNSKIPFCYDPFKNYLYDRNKKEAVKYNTISEIFKKLKNDDGTTRILLMKQLGDEENLKGLSFTFKDQVQYGIIILLFHDFYFSLF